MNAIEPTFFAVRPATSATRGTLRVDKSVIASRVKAAPGVAADDESMLARVLEAIRAFIASICRTFGLRKDPPATTAAQDDAQAAPSMTETKDEIKVEGLPESALDRVRKTVDEMVSAADGASLSNSLRSALLSMPDMGKRQVFRVLLSQNSADTLNVRQVSATLKSNIERMVAPFAEKHGLAPDAVLELFRADLDGEGGSIANRIDPKGEIRGHVEELKRLDSALAGLARHRGTICALAIDSGVCTHEDVSAMLEQQGIDAAFLSAADSPASTPTTEASEAVTHLVKLGMVDAAQAEKIAHAAGVDAALSAEKEFDTGGQDSDLIASLNGASTLPRAKL